MELYDKETERIALEERRKNMPFLKRLRTSRLKPGVKFVLFLIVVGALLAILGATGMLGKISDFATKNLAPAIEDVASSLGFDGAESTQDAGEFDSAMIATGQGSGDTYIDGRGFAAMMGQIEQWVELRNSIVQDASTAAFDESAAALYLEDIASTRVDMINLQVSSCYLDAIEGFAGDIVSVEDALQGYVDGTVTQEGLIETLNSTSFQDSREALYEAAQTAGANVNMYEDGSLTYQYYDY